MSYLEHHTEDIWQKRLFDKLMRVEDKLNRLLILQEQSVDTTVHPPLKRKRPYIIGCGQEKFPISKPMAGYFFFGKR